MDFFKQEDFDFFSSVRGKRYHKGDPSDWSTGMLIRSTVLDKTRYWALLIQDKGYEILMEDRWQTSGYFISYTWARVMLPGVENKKVFFTIGVGSRFSEEGTPVLTLDYKLDCLRANNNSLDASMVYLFDKYMGENCAEARLIQTDLNEVENWNDLIALVLPFLRSYQTHYLKVAELTMLSSGNLLKRIVRLCWNENAWERPSGPIGKSGSKGHAFEKDKGYGYEEWLFNARHEIDGYRYGFIQSFNKGGHHGQRFEVSAYAIQNLGHFNQYHWIGKFPAIEVLTVHQQSWALKEFKNRGWMDQMRGELQKVGIADFDFGPIADEYIINVRYRSEPDSFIRYPEPIMIEDPEQEIGGNRHYVLLPKKSWSVLDEVPLGKFTFHEGHIDTLTGERTAKRSATDYLMRLKHKEIQKKIYLQLTEEYSGTSRKLGTENRTPFGKSIDMVVACPENGTYFYEIKTCRSALQCIREALGQLLEYSCYIQNAHAKHLVVIGLDRPSKNVTDYLSIFANYRMLISIISILMRLMKSLNLNCTNGLKKICSTFKVWKRQHRRMRSGTAEKLRPLLLI